MKALSVSKTVRTLLLLAGLLPFSSLVAQRWTEERALDWQRRAGWIRGANFIPSTAINQLEMWQPETFDTVTISRELNWAREIGFNSVRVFLHNLVWSKDSLGFYKRIDQFLAIADRNGIGVMLVLFDGVWDPYPRLGPQRPPRPRIHNSGWVQSPGADYLGNPKRHDELKGYVQSVIRRFARDRRVQVWDLFNEPTNTFFYQATEIKNKTELAFELMKKAFAWAREVAPRQPLTVAAWLTDLTDSTQLSAADRYALEESDIITFHSYLDSASVSRTIAALGGRGRRPILCTEFLARSTGSRIQTIFPLLKARNVGGYIWGFVAGKTQTIYPWDSWGRAYADDPKPWHHDLLRPDGVPYDEEEVQLIKVLTGITKQ